MPPMASDYAADGIGLLSYECRYDAMEPLDQPQRDDSPRHVYSSSDLGNGSINQARKQMNCLRVCCDKRWQLYACYPAP